MKRSTKILLIIATALVICGGSLFASSMALADWDFNIISTENYEINEYEIKESFDSLSVLTDTTDVIVLPSTDGTCKVICCEYENEKHSVAVENGKLTIKLEDTRKWYEHIQLFNLASTKINVYMPADRYGALSIKSTTGDVEISRELSFESIDIKVSTGDVKCHATTRSELSIAAGTGDICIQNISAEKINISVTSGRVEAFDVSCTGDLRINVNTGSTKLERLKVGSLHSNGDSGDITLTSVIVAGKIDISRDTGDVKFEHSDASDIYVRTDTGDVRGTLLSSKMFFVHSDTGVERVPKCNSGGICEVNSDTGDIIFEIVD